MKKTIFLTLLSVVLLNSISYAQTRLKSTVVDQNSAPIIGATILIQNDSTNLGKLTDVTGTFEVELAPGNYSLEVRYLGFQPYKQQIELSGDSTVLENIVLQEGAEQLQNVEIIGRIRRDYNSDYSFSASKVAIKNRELPQAVAAVTKELIADRQAFQLGEAVKAVSNVSLTGLYNHYNIRGITQADDGQMLNGMRTRQYYFLQPITSHLERVEVIKVLLR